MDKTKKPVAKKPVAKKPVAKKPTAKKTTVQKAVSRKVEPAKAKISGATLSGKPKIPKGGILIGSTYAFNRDDVDTINEFFCDKAGMRQVLNMPYETTPENFDIRWLIAFRSRAFNIVVPPNEDPNDYYMEPWDKGDPSNPKGDIQAYYNQINAMVHFVGDLNLKQLLGRINHGMPAHELFKHFYDRTERNVHLDREEKEFVKATLGPIIDYLSNGKYAQTRFRTIFKMDMKVHDKFKQNVIDPLIQLKKGTSGTKSKKGVKTLCIPFIRKHIDSSDDPDEGSWDKLELYSLFQAHLTPKIGAKILGGAKAAAKKAQEQAALDAKRKVSLYGPITTLGDPGGNNYKCTENPTGTFKCVRLNTYYCNPTPNGSCSIV